MPIWKMPEYKGQREGGHLEVRCKRVNGDLIDVQENFIECVGVALDDEDDPNDSAPWDLLKNLIENTGLKPQTQDYLQNMLMTMLSVATFDTKEPQ